MELRIYFRHLQLYDVSGNAIVYGVPSGNGGNSYVLEIKKGQLEFKGDPLDFNLPELTAANEIFYLSDCSGII